METWHLLEKYKKIREQTLLLCEPLNVEDYIPQPIVDVSPPKWHLGHTTWFFENFILSQHQEKFQLFRKGFNFIFNSYYESQGPRAKRHTRGDITRPTVAEVKAYRESTDQRMLEFIQKGNLTDEIIDFIELGLQHEQQHQELLITDLKYTLGLNPLFPAYQPELKYPRVNAQDTIRHEYLKIEEGVYEVGYNGSDFCFDNEKGVHKVYLQPFQVMNRLVTNREYLEFMDAKGYEQSHLWLMEGWEWVNVNQVNAPLYWERIYDEWKMFTLYGLQDIDLEAPVTHISFYEADAFARWKQKRLLTEFEWEVAAKQLNAKVTDDSNFVESNALTPLGRQKGNSQMFGDAWEWTNSAYLPYPYYKQAEGALGEYNGKFMINQMVLRGGSCVTPKDHIRSTYRNFFHPDKKWQFTGIRLAESC